MGAPTHLLATRASPLALAQARAVLEALRESRPDMRWETLPVVSQGDRTPGPLADAGGKELFVKALEERLADGQARAAAHSLKDVGSALADGFVLAGVAGRADPRDALVGHDGLRLDELQPGSVVGTSSPRRTALLRHLRPDLRAVPVRGNVGTRLAKLERREVDALILAAAGLDRLGLGHRATERLDPEIFIPAACQGAIGIECMRKDREMIELAHAIGSDDAMAVSRCERAVAARIGGDCHTALGAHATLDGGRITVRAILFDAAGAGVRTVSESGDAADPEAIGARAGQRLLEPAGGRPPENHGTEDESTWQT